MAGIPFSLKEYKGQHYEWGGYSLGYRFSLALSSQFFTEMELDFQSWKVEDKIISAKTLSVGSYGRMNIGVNGVWYWLQSFGSGVGFGYSYLYDDPVGGNKLSYLYAQLILIRLKMGAAFFEGVLPTYDQFNEIDSCPFIIRGGVWFLDSLFY